MAYTKTTWTDKAVEFAQRYFMNWDGGNDKNLLPPFTDWTLYNKASVLSTYVGKVSGSTVENPNILKYGFASTLVSPAGSTENTNQTQITNVSTLNGALNSQTTSNNLVISQTLFSFDLIAIIERKYSITLTGTTADKVTWLKANVTKLTGNWHGFGSGPSGNKASFAPWTGSAYGAAVTTTNSTVTKLSRDIIATISTAIDANGFVHFLAYADASNGTIASTINTDYIELITEANVVAGITVSDAVVTAPYTLTLNTSVTSGAATDIIIPVVAGQTYKLSADLTGSADIRFRARSNDSNGAILATLTATGSASVVVPADVNFVHIACTNNNTGTYTWTNPQLELGSTATAFTPKKLYTIKQSNGTVTQAGTPVNAANLNIMEQGIDDAHALNVDDVTVVDTSAPTGDTVAPKTLFNWFANMIKQITGKANWRTTPRTTLENAVKLSGDTMTGTLAISQANGGIELGTNTVNTPFLDFHSSANTIDYDSRIIASGGTAANGNGVVNVIASALQMNGVSMAQTRTTNGYVEWNNAGTWQGVGGVKSVQRGSVTIANVSPWYTDVTITSVNTSKSFTTFNSSMVYSGSTTNFRLELLNSTTLRFYNVGGQGTPAVSWEVIESY